MPATRAFTVSYRLFLSEEIIIVQTARLCSQNGAKVFRRPPLIPYRLSAVGAARTGEVRAVRGDRPVCPVTPPRPAKAETHPTVVPPCLFRADRRVRGDMGRKGTTTGALNAGRPGHGAAPRQTAVPGPKPAVTHGTDGTVARPRPPFLYGDEAAVTLGAVPSRPPAYVDHRRPLRVATPYAADTPVRASFADRPSNTRLGATGFV